MDHLSSAQRSRVMSRIRSRDTKPERFVRRRFWSQGFRYARSPYHLPGTPDLLLPRYKVAIFVHGCFWHAHNCPRGRLPATNREFWRAKLLGNRRRDQRAMRQLRRLGWHCFQIWQCRLKADTQRVLTLVQGIRFVFDRGGQRGSASAPKLDIKDRLLSPKR